jgi:hypothetical protein
MIIQEIILIHRGHRKLFRYIVVICFIKIHLLYLFYVHHQESIHYTYFTFIISIKQKKVSNSLIAKQAALSTCSDSKANALKSKIIEVESVDGMTKRIQNKMKQPQLQDKLKDVLVTEQRQRIDAASKNYKMQYGAGIH